MIKSIKSASILALAIAASGSFVQAKDKSGRNDEHKVHVESMFVQHDGNKDGVIQKDEMIAAHADQFKQLDSNSDGFITLDEMPTSPKELKKLIGHKMHKMHKRMHEEKFVVKTIEDGVETVLVGDAAKKYMKEHEAVGEDHMFKEVEVEVKRGKRHGKRHKGQMTRMKAMVKMDRNGDEKISLDEFTAKVSRHFKRKDANGDGSISMEEALKGKPHEKKRGHKKIKKADKKR